MKTILLTGRTELLSTTLLEQLSVRFSVVLTTEDRKWDNDIVRAYHVQPGSPSFEELFWSYDFNAVWYIAPYCDGQPMPEDMKPMKNILHHCREFSVPKLIVLSFSYLSPDQIRLEEEVLSSSDHNIPQTTVLRAPFLLTGINEYNMLGTLFSSLYTKSEARIPQVSEGRYEFLDLKDLVRLMTRITLSAREQGFYSLPGEYVISLSHLDEEMKNIHAGSKLIPTQPLLTAEETENISVLTRKYMYRTHDQKALDFRSLYLEYEDRQKKRAGGFFSRLSSWRERLPCPVMVFIDIAVLFILAQYISNYTADNVYFRFIDVRLLFIIMIAVFHGLRAGVFAAILECIVLYFIYLDNMGISSLQLFYNVENWIPFVLYIVAGAITGYFSDLKESEKALVVRENDLLREKYLFLNDMYNVTSEAKDEYKRQILTFDHSYGKIYHAIEHMSRDSVEEVCSVIPEVIEDLLNNTSAAVFRMDSSQKRVEFLAGDRTFSSGVARNLSLQEMEEALSCMNEGNVWRNTALAPGIPMYAMKIDPRASGKEESSRDSLIIAIWDATPEQMNDYYSNQFEIICRLAGYALERAGLTQEESRQA